MRQVEALCAGGSELRLQLGYLVFLKKPFSVRQMPIHCLFCQLSLDVLGYLRLEGW